MFSLYKTLLTIINSGLWKLFYLLFSPYYLTPSIYFYNTSPRICNLVLSFIFWKCKKCWKYVFQCLSKHIWIHFLNCVLKSAFPKVCHDLFIGIRLKKREKVLRNFGKRQAKLKFFSTRLLRAFDVFLGYPLAISYFPHVSGLLIGLVFQWKILESAGLNIVKNWIHMSKTKRVRSFTRVWVPTHSL